MIGDVSKVDERVPEGVFVVPTSLGNELKTIKVKQYKSDVR